MQIFKNSSTFASVMLRLVEKQVLRSDMEMKPPAPQKIMTYWSTDDGQTGSQGSFTLGPLQTIPIIVKHRGDTNLFNKYIYAIYICTYVSLKFYTNHIIFWRTELSRDTHSARQNNSTLKRVSDKLAQKMLFRKGFKTKIFLLTHCR